MQPAPRTARLTQCAQSRNTHYVTFRPRPAPVPGFSLAREDVPHETFLHLRQGYRVVFPDRAALRGFLYEN